MKFLFKLAIFLLAANALFRFVPPYWTHTQFEQDLEETSIGWREYSESEIRELVLAMAQEHGVPVEREQIAVRRERDHLFVDLAYDRRMALIPGSKYTWSFESNVDTWMLTPQVGR